VGGVEMIILGSKNKVLLFDISTEEISNESLEFWFRVNNEDITYSFRGELTEDNKVKIVLKPLTEIINSNYLDISKIYTSKLEVIGDGKYYMTPWEGELKLEVSPKIGVKLENIFDEKFKKPTLIETKKVVVEKIVEELEEPETTEKPEEIKEELHEKEEIKKESVENLNKMGRSSLLEDVLRTNFVKTKDRKRVDILAELK